ncbi:hypothetical protein ACFX14_010192 [Malus domestica]
MTRNSETTTSGTSYIQGFGPSDGDRDIALPQQSMRLNMMTSRVAPSPQRTIVAMPTAAATVAAHSEGITLQSLAQARATCSSEPRPVPQGSLTWLSASRPKLQPHLTK